MGQKLLAYLFYGFLVLMVIAALILLKYQLDQKDVKQQQIDSRANVVSRVDTESTQTEHQKSTIEQPDKKLISTTEETKKASQNDIEQLSYLDIYYQLKDAKTCQPIFYQWQTKGMQADLTTLVGSSYRYYDSPDYGDNEKPAITAEQQTLLKQWHDKCLALWQTYGDFDVKNKDQPTLISGITESIEHRLNNTATQTPHEIELKNVIKISLQWQQSYKALEQVLEGEDSLSELEMTDINNQINQLESQQNQLLFDLPDPAETDESIDQATITEISHINKELRRLQNLRQEQKVINPELAQQHRNTFAAIDQQLFSYFNTSYGEVFYEALITVVGFENGRYIGSGYSRGGEAKNQRITPVDMVLEANNISATRWYSEPLNAATHLYLCDLGMRCGSDSPLMFDYCLQDYQVFPDACGLSIRDFYKNHFISPNQWQDVQTFKNSYEDLFHG